MQEKPTPSSSRLLAIIALQNAIAGARMDLSATMQVVVDSASMLTSAAGTVIELVEGDEMVYRAASSAMSATLGLRLKRATSLSGMCVQARVPLSCEDTESDERVDRNACRRVGARSMVCVPLFHEQEAVGVLKVLAPIANAFAAEDIATLELLGHIIGLSLHHAKIHEAAVHDSLHDALTGLGNRRAFEVRLAEEMNRFRRYRHPLTLALFDLDSFKQRNDRDGHAAGDRTLQAVAQILREGSRTTDYAFRFGGDEFALLLPHTNATDAEVVVSRLVAAVDDVRSSNGGVGMSAGIAESEQDGEKGLTQRADEALYANKRSRKRDLSPPGSPAGGSSA